MKFLRYLYTHYVLIEHVKKPLDLCIISYNLWIFLKCLLVLNKGRGHITTPHTPKKTQPIKQSITYGRIQKFKISLLVKRLIN